MDEILRELAAKLFEQYASMSMLDQIKRLSELGITDHDEVMIVLQEYRRLQSAAKPWKRDYSLGPGAPLVQDGLSALHLTLN